MDRQLHEYVTSTGHQLQRCKLTHKYSYKKKNWTKWNRIVNCMHTGYSFSTLISFNKNIYSNSYAYGCLNAILSIDLMRQHFTIHFLLQPNHTAKNSQNQQTYAIERSDFVISLWNKAWVSILNSVLYKPTTIVKWFECPEQSSYPPLTVLYKTTYWSCHIVFGSCHLGLGLCQHVIMGHEPNMTHV